MQLAADRPPGWFWVDWWLHNHCSWHCTYCPDILRSGHIPWPDLTASQHFLHAVNDHAGSRGLRPQIKFTGGEPTEWQSLEDLLHCGRELNISLGLRTNAAVPRARWIDLCETLDRVEMTLHPEHTQTSQFLINLDTAYRRGVTVRVVFNMLPQRFQELEQVLNMIKQKYPGIDLERRMLFEDPAINKQPMNYDPDQQQKVLNQGGDILYTTDQGVERTDYPTLVFHGKNKFLGWQCRAGQEQIIVDAWGRVARGHCRQGGHIGSVGQNINWPNTPQRCHRPNCANAFDILATKTLV